MNITTSLVVLNPGMYILRHPKGGQPAMTVTRAVGTSASNGKIELIGTRNTHGSILRDGSDCIVMHISEGPVELAVSAYLPDASTPVPSLRIDQVGLDPAPSAAALPAGAQATQAPIRISQEGLSIIAHIERTGDVVGSGGAPVGDPAQALRVEGFQLMWPDRPDGVDLASSVSVEGVGPMPTVMTGKFCGTRGQARRITELSFTLVGPEAARYALEGVAYFSGGFQLPISSGATLGGPSGLEHLTALSLKAVPAAAAPNPWTDSERTKVFRAKAASPAKPAAKKKAATSTTKAPKA